MFNHQTERICLFAKVINLLKVFALSSLVNDYETFAMCRLFDQNMDYLKSYYYSFDLMYWLQNLLRMKQGAATYFSYQRSLLLDIIVRSCKNHFDQ